MAARRGLLIGGTAVLGFGGYYLYQAGGDPKVAEKKLEGMIMFITSIRQRAFSHRHFHSLPLMSILLLLLQKIDFGVAFDHDDVHMDRRRNYPYMRDGKFAS